MTLIDALLNFATTAGIAFGLFGAAVLVAGAIMSFFVDETHPALQLADANPIVPCDRAVARSGGALAVAA